MTDLSITRPFSEDDYNELLRQAVAVIETSRLQIAKRVQARICRQDEFLPFPIG